MYLYQWVRRAVRRRALHPLAQVRRAHCEEAASPLRQEGDPPTALLGSHQLVQHGVLQESPPAVIEATQGPPQPPMPIIIIIMISKYRIIRYVPMEIQDHSCLNI